MNTLFWGHCNTNSKDRPFRIHLLQMSDGSPHPEVIDPIITGPIFPSGTYIVNGGLQVTGCRLAARVVLREPSGKSERLIVWDWKTGEKCTVRSSRFPLHHGSSILLFFFLNL